MAARSIGSGTIAFGMVAIPVKLYTASASSEAIRFNQLHAKCGTRLKQKLVCPKDEEEVERDDIVKGYEFAKGQFVTFTKEELARMEEESTGSIDITEFVPLDKVDPVYFDKAFYLGPEKAGARPYALLAEAMRRTGLCAIANYAARGKGYLVMLRPTDDGIVLQQLHYAHEVRSMSEVPLPEARVEEAELGLAMTLVQHISKTDFDPSKYSDAVRDRVLELIQKKVEGEEITATPVESPKAQVIDLMAALKASLAASGVEGEEARKGPKRAERDDDAGPAEVEEG
jgi:DNA end-binding protein Ku